MRKKLLLIPLILSIILLHWPLFQVRELAPGVIARPLGPCDLDWHSDRDALVLACPGRI